LDFTEAIEVDPKCTLAYNYRGRVWLELGNLDKSIADYTEAIRLDPKFPNAYYGRSKAYAKKGEWKKAVEDEAKARELGGMLW
jgi:tetratricopeptide (TPR) repeat protein